MPGATFVAPPIVGFKVRAHNQTEAHPLVISSMGPVMFVFDVGTQRPARSLSLPPEVEKPFE